jgi:hypothetical protein
MRGGAAVGSVVVVFELSVVVVVEFCPCVVLVVEELPDDVFTAGSETLDALPVALLSPSISSRERFILSPAMRLLSHL